MTTITISQPGDCISDMTSEGNTCLMVNSTRVSTEKFPTAFKEVQRRSEVGVAVIPKLSVTNNGLLAANREEEQQPEEITKVKSKTHPDKKRKKENTIINMLPYYWKRSESICEQPKPAEDRIYAYQNTYNDQISKPTSLKVQVDMPLLRQKTEAKMSLKSVVKTEDNSDKFHLPPDIVSRIYNQLHDSSQDRRSMYVVQNMRRTTPHNSTRSLPTILPFYHIQLVQAASKVISNGFVTATALTKPLEPEVIPQPMPESLKKKRPKTPGHIIKGKRTSLHQAKRKEDLEEISDCLTSKVFKSAEAYNKLLQERLKQKKDRISTIGKPNKTGAYKNPNRHDDYVGADNSTDDELPKDFITAVRVSKRSAWS